MTTSNGGNISTATAAEPMMEMNTTPLIDVMLVLLIMFIITLPPMTNTVTIDLPSGPVGDPFVPDPVVNKVVILENNEIQWNGTPVSLDQMDNYLRQTTAMRPEPELQFQPAPNAVYNTVAHTLARIKRSGVEQFGFVGNEQYRSFAKADRQPI